jgi:hypothetical protein
MAKVLHTIIEDHRSVQAPPTQHLSGFPNFPNWAEHEHLLSDFLIYDEPQVTVALMNFSFFFVDCFFL